MGIHNYEAKYQASLREVQEAEISNKNKELILAFVNDLVLEGLSKPRLMKYCNVLKLISMRLNKDMNKATMSDIKQFVSTIQQNSKYSPWTKQSYKIIIRRFYKWVYKTKDYPPIVDWISINISRSEKPLPSEGDLLTEEDVQKLLQSAEHPRDKALVSILWESGCRIGEVGDLNIHHVVFDEYGTVISVKGKTGSRKVRLLFSTQYLAAWLSIHPFQKDIHSPLWINIGTTNHHESMTYGALRLFLIRLFNRAGIQKPSNPHLFRHSRATFMAHHLTEFQMNQYFGWIQGSKMPSTYVHMSGRDVDSAILKMNGFQQEHKKEETKLQPRKCMRCENLNSNEGKFCWKCGAILDLKYAVELQEIQKKQEEMRTSADDLMNMLLKDKDVQKLLQEKLTLLTNKET